MVFQHAEMFMGNLFANCLISLVDYQHENAYPSNDQSTTNRHHREDLGMEGTSESLEDGCLSPRNLTG